MAKAKNKTQETDAPVEAYLAGIDNEKRARQCRAVHDLMAAVTRRPARMWGSSIVGFGRYEYRYESGREGEFMLTGFSPRKANLVVYVMPGYDDLDERLAELGKHKLGKSCLYINKLADVDLAVLERIIADGVATMRRNHETTDD